METTATEYLIYPAPDCPQGWFIKEFPSGRKILIEIDPVTQKETFIKTL